MTEKALVAVIQEAWIGGVSTRRVDDLVQAMGLSGISKSQVSKLCKEIDERVGAFLERPLEGDWPYLWLDATYLKQREGGRIVSVAAIIAMAINTDGRREIIGLKVGPSEAETFWSGFLKALVRRGLKGVKLVVSDAHEGLKQAIARVLGVTWQRCRVGPLKKLVLVSGSGGRAAVLGRRSLERRAGEELDRDDEPSIDHGADRHDQTAEQFGGEPLEIDGSRREESLDAHVLQAAANRSAQPVPSFRLAMKAFRAPAVALVEPGVGLRPAVLAAAGAQQGRVVVADHYGLVGPALGQAVAAHRAAMAVRRA